VWQEKKRRVRAPEGGLVAGRTVQPELQHLQDITILSYIIIMKSCKIRLQ
jgi:hypothetical protein